MIHIKLPFKTPTVNKLYWHKGNIKIIKTEAKKLREVIYSHCLPFKEQALEYKDLKLSVNVFICDNWLNKDGTIKKKDVMNREKYLIDSVFKALDIDDKQIWDIYIQKDQHLTKEQTIVQIDDYKGGLFHETNI